MLDHVGFYNKITAFAHEVFAGLEPYLQLPAVFFFIRVESLGNFVAQCCHICLYIAFLVGYFKAAAKVNEFEFGKMACHVKHYF